MLNDANSLMIYDYQKVFGQKHNKHLSGKYSRDVDKHGCQYRQSNEDRLYKSPEI